MNEINSGANELAIAEIKRPREAYLIGSFLPYLSEILPDRNEPIK